MSMPNWTLNKIVSSFILFFFNSNHEIHNFNYSEKMPKKIQKFDVLQRKHETYVVKLLMICLRVKFENKSLFAYIAHLLLLREFPTLLCCAVVIYTEVLASCCTTICVIRNYEYKLWRPEKHWVLLSETQASSHFPFITNR